MKNFKALAKQVAAVDPPLMNMTDYEPENEPAACPPLSEDWEVSSAALPPTPDEETCECMFAGLSCVPTPSLDEEQYAGIFDYICDAKGGLCKGIQGNATAGEYGAFSMCNAEQKLGYVLDQYYKQQKEAKDACDFRGQATEVTAEEGASGCEERLNRATEAAGVGGSSGGNGDEEDGVGRIGVGVEVGLVAVGLAVVWGML